MDAGKLVSDEIVIGIARERLEEEDAKKGFMLDGFPRTIAQAEALDALLAELGQPLECCLALTVDEEAVVERLLKRAEIEGRADDNEEAIRERMTEYRDKTAPLLAYYERAGKLVSVDGMGEIDEDDGSGSRRRSGREVRHAHPGQDARRDRRRCARWASTSPRSCS